jgi:hypothetical protein
MWAIRHAWLSNATCHCCRKRDRPEEVKHFTDSSGVRPAVRVEAAPFFSSDRQYKKSKRRFIWNSGQTRKSQNLMRSIGRSRIPERSTQPMVREKMCGEDADMGCPGLHENPTLQIVPFGRKTRPPSVILRYSLTSDRMAPASLTKTGFSKNYTPATQFRQGALARITFAYISG